jgi:hypothetical protein
MSGSSKLKSKSPAFSVMRAGFTRLGDHHYLALQCPAQQDLGGRLAVPARDPDSPPDPSASRPGERAVGLELYPLPPAEFEQVPLVKERAELDLVY